jgi:hypothetical protein
MGVWGNQMIDSGDGPIWSFPRPEYNNKICLEFKQDKEF